MEIITIEGTSKIPDINFNPANGLLEIKGRSIPEHSVSFYKPLLDWLDEYAENPQPQTTVNIELDYFNTSSSKCILDVFRRIENIHNGGKSIVIVNWYYEEGDEDILEAGEHYQAILKMPFETIEMKEE